MRKFDDAITIIIGVLMIGGSFILASEVNSNYDFSGFGASVSARDKDSLDFTVKENFFDFGSISKREADKSHIFDVKNISNKDIVISKVYTSSESLDAFIKIGEYEAGPFNITDYLFPFYSKKIVEKESNFYIKVVLRPNNLGPLGVGLTEPFAVVEDITGRKVTLKISALVFP